MSVKRLIAPAITIALLAGCAGTERSCSAFNAKTFGANWVVAQIGADGKPARCWLLHGVSVANEDKSDGIHWLGRDGDLIHLAGWVDRVQVGGANFERAAAQLGIANIETCSKG